MKRPARASGRSILVEPLEPRTLLSGDDLFVRFAAGESASAQRSVLEALGASVVTKYPDGPELISPGKGISAASAIQKLDTNPGVVYAAPDSTIHIASTPALPNDTNFGQLWGLNNANNVDIDAPEAWQVTIGTPSTIVAVIDTGIDLNNPDFAGKIWTNPGNDAAEGYPNDLHGWNFITNTPNVQDDDGHGTHVSAIIAAVGDNNYGVIGVDPKAQIMPLKFLDANGNGSTSDAVSAIYFAVQHGAKVINASWGGVDSSAPLDDAIAYANAHNVVFVTAAGNDGTNNDIFPSFPASYRQPNELSVAAVDRNGNLASFSDYGPSTVDLAAPGVDIISDVPTSIDPSGLQDLSGISMSTAYVSGVAALVSGLAPQLTAAQVVQRLDATTKALPSLAGLTISGGIVDAYNAVAESPSQVASPGSNSVVVTAGLPDLTPGASSDTTLQAWILGTDEFFANQGATPTGFIDGLFATADGRFPTSTELQYWTEVYDSGTATRFQIADAFLTSPEARLTEVARWYQQDLGRTASLASLELDPGVNALAAQLVTGTADDVVRAEILSSPEYLTDHGSSPSSIVQGYYANLEGRAADPGALASLVKQFRKHVSAFNIVRGLQASAEVQRTKVAIWFAQDLGSTETLAQLKVDPTIQSLASDLTELKVVKAATKH